MRSAALERLGGTIRSYRKERGLTQEALAEAADLHENYVSRLETGDQEPGLFVILRLCRALNVSPGELLVAFTPAALKRLRLR